MENCGKPEGARGHAQIEARACSACAGDYEDPDRTAWGAAEEDEPAPGEDGEDEGHEG